MVILYIIFYKQVFKTLFILYRELFKITKQIFYLEIVHKCSCEKERQLVLQPKEGEKSASLILDKFGLRN